MTEAAERYQLSSDAMCKRLGDEIVILDLASGTYFGLNDVGGRVWELIGNEICETSAICAALAEEYDVGQNELEADVTALLADLVARKLIFTAA